MPSSPPTTGLLTAAQVAAHFGVDVWTIRKWMRTDRCPVIHDGRKRRIPAAWVADPQGWMA